MNQSRWRSKTAWAAAISLALFVAKTYFGVEVPEVDKLTELILVTFTAVGVFNNPMNGDGY
jgi:uncharacterized membrane protein